MRCLLVGLLLVLCSGDSPAQNPIGASAGVGSFGGGFRPPMPSAAPRPFRPASFLNPVRTFPFTGGFGGGFISSPYYMPYYVVPGPGFYYDAPIEVPAPAPAP